MNTSTLYHKYSGPANPHRNVCFATKEAKLFDVIENGQVKGIYMGLFRFSKILILLVMIRIKRGRLENFD